MTDYIDLHAGNFWVQSISLFANGNNSSPNLQVLQNAISIFVSKLYSIAPFPFVCLFELICLQYIFCKKCSFLQNIVLWYTIKTNHLKCILGRQELISSFSRVKRWESLKKETPLYLLVLLFYYLFLFITLNVASFIFKNATHYISSFFCLHFFFFLQYFSCHLLFFHFPPSPAFFLVLFCLLSVI